MPARTPPPRRAATTNRFSRTGAATRSGDAGRFSRPLSVQKPSGKGRKAKAQGGLTGLLTSAASPLSGGKTSRGKAKRPTGASRGSKAKPAMALLAAAGAVLGKRQMDRRKRADATDLATPPAT